LYIHNNSFLFGTKGSEKHIVAHIRQLMVERTPKLAALGLVKAKQ
jgi:hypothetical protein